MGIYEKIKKIGKNAVAEADAFMQSLTKKYTEKSPAPAELIQQGLEGILTKYQAKTGTSTNTSTVPHAAGLAAVLAGIAILAGFPYVPSPIY